MLTQRHLLASAGAIALGAANGEAHADAGYASQPIHILVGYAAGGGVDIIARLLQDPLTDRARADRHHRKPHGRERDAGDRRGREGGA